MQRSKSAVRAPEKSHKSCSWDKNMWCSCLAPSGPRRLQPPPQIKAVCGESWVDISNKITKGFNFSSVLHPEESSSSVMKLCGSSLDFWIQVELSLYISICVVRKGASWFLFYFDAPPWSLGAAASPHIQLGCEISYFVLLSFSSCQSASE